MVRKISEVVDHHALNHRIIPPEDRLHRKPADAGPRKHILHHERATQEIPDLEADDGDDGNQRVAEGMAEDDGALSQAFRRANRT